MAMKQPEIDPETMVRFDRISAHVNGCLAINSENRVWWSDYGAQTLFGYTWRDLRGLDINQLLPDEYRDENHENIEDFKGRLEVSRSMGFVSTKVIGLTKNDAQIELNVFLSQVSDMSLAAIMVGDTKIPHEARIELDALSFMHFALSHTRRMEEMERQIGKLNAQMNGRVW